MYILHVPLLTLKSLCYFIPPLYCSVIYNQLFINYFTRCGLDQLLPSFCNLRSCIVYHSLLYLRYPTARKIALHLIPISCWNSCCFSLPLVYLHLYSFLPRLFWITLVCWRSVHIRQCSVVGTSAAQTCTSVSLLLLFSSTVKSRMELSPFCMHCLVHSGPDCFFIISFNAFISLFLLVRNISISAPFLSFVTSPYCPFFSFGLLAFPILELKSPTNTTPPCPLYLCRCCCSH